MGIVLSPSQFRRLSRVAAMVERMPRRYVREQMVGRPRSAGSAGRIRSARLVTRTSLAPAGSRWAYNCVLGRISPTGAWVPDSPVVNVVVWNKFELTALTQLTGVQPDGVDQRAAAGYPQTFRMIPIGGGTDLNPGNLAIISVWLEAQSDGTLQWYCDRKLEHNGTC